MAVTAPKRRRRRGRKVKRVLSREARRMRTRFSRVEDGRQKGAWRELGWWRGV